MSRLVAIVGPTASGKSELAMGIAKRFGGEIICADSRTIYRGMDIGTAKPSQAQQQEIPHHLLDISEPNQTFSAAEFKLRAQRSIRSIEANGHLPILVGGSGLYLYAVLYDYQFPAGPANELRLELQQLPIERLVERLRQVDPEAAESVDLNNPRRVIRAIETAGQSRQQTSLRKDTVLVGLRPTDMELSRRIEDRTERMLDLGLIEEVKGLVEKFGNDLELFRSPGYAEVIGFLNGKIDQSRLAAQIAVHTRQLAKRQLTWFRRNQDINWFDSSDEAGNYITSELAGKV